MIRKFFYTAGILLLLTVIGLSIEFAIYSSKRNAMVEDQGKETTEQLKQSVDAILARIQNEAQRLTEELEKDSLSEGEVKELIKKSALSISEIQGVTIGYEPFAFEENMRLFCPYYDKGTQEFLMVEQSYDYTQSGDKKTDWYTTVRDKGAKWVEPYYAFAAKDWYVDYGVPFYYTKGPKKGQVRGTVTMSFRCGGFNDLVHGLALGKTGFGVISSSKGTFLSHPNTDFIGSTKLDDSLVVATQPAMVEAYATLGKKQGAGMLKYSDQSTEGALQQGLFFYDQIPTSGWSIGLAFFKKDMLNDGKAMNRRYIRLGIAISLFLLSLLAIYYNKDELDEREIWKLSIVGSLLLVSNIVFMGYLTHTSPLDHGTNSSAPLVDLSTLSNYIQKQQARSKQFKTEPKTPIPTGLYIQKMEFEDSYNLNVGGTLWQKYPLDVVDEVEIGFRFPQISPFAESSYIEESYRERIEKLEGKAGYLLVGYDFRVTLRLNFSYASYPLDDQHINIEIEPLNVGDNLLFTPDLASYDYTNPSKKSGLNPRVKISGSDVLETYFNYTTESFDTDFGYGSKAAFEEVPILHYNIYLRRILLNPFVTYLIPIFVVLVMMFILITAASKSNERQGIIESMAAFFFVLIFSHIDLRKEIVTGELIYMEFFYFVTYFIVLASTFNLVVYTKGKDNIFDFNNNQLFKASYFPVFFLVILIVTLLKFY